MALGRIATFGFVGLLATATHTLIGVGLLRAGLATAFWANGIAFSVAFLVSYGGHRSLTFRSRLPHRIAGPRFLTVATVGLGLNQIMVFILVNLLKVPYEFALVPIFIVVPVVTYLLSRDWAFGGADLATRGRQG